MCKICSSNSFSQYESLILVLFIFVVVFVVVLPIAWNVFPDPLKATRKKLYIFSLLFWGAVGNCKTTKFITSIIFSFFLFHVNKSPKTVFHFHFWKLFSPWLLPVGLLDMKKTSHSTYVRTTHITNMCDWFNFLIQQLAWQERLEILCVPARARVRSFVCPTN